MPEFYYYLKLALPILLLANVQSMWVDTEIPDQAVTSAGFQVFSQDRTVDSSKHSELCAMVNLL